MKKHVVWLVLALMFLACAPSGATTVLLSSSYRAEITSIQIYDEFAYTDMGYGEWGGFGGETIYSASHITPIVNNETSSIRFSMATGSVTVGQQQALAGDRYQAITDRFSSLRFNWATYWSGSAAEYLTIEAWGKSETGYFRLATLTPGAGLNNGYCDVDTAGRWYGGFDFYLSAGPVVPVPEPSAFLALASGLAGIGAARIRCRRRRAS